MAAGRARPALEPRGGIRRTRAEPRGSGGRPLGLDESRSYCPPPVPVRRAERSCKWRRKRPLGNRETRQGFKTQNAPLIVALQKRCLAPRVVAEPSGSGCPAADGGCRARLRRVLRYERLDSRTGFSSFCFRLKPPGARSLLSPAAAIRTPSLCRWPRRAVRSTFGQLSSSERRSFLHAEIGPGSGTERGTARKAARRSGRSGSGRCRGARSRHVEPPRRAAPLRSAHVSATRRPPAASKGRADTRRAWPGRWRHSPRRRPIRGSRRRGAASAANGRRRRRNGPAGGLGGRREGRWVRRGC